jgi:phytoene/squalene synthetase
VFLPPAEFVRAPAALAAGYDTAQAQAYTRWLATHHYENFQVVSWLLPRNLHQDFYNVYAFCRWADDLGDEIGDRAESLRLLAWWQHELTRCTTARQRIRCLSRSWAPSSAIAFPGSRSPI